MCKTKSANRLLPVTSVLWVCALVAIVEPARSQPDPNLSSATSATGVLFSCPAGDGDLLSGKGLSISATIVDNTNTGIGSIPATDFWLEGCATGLSLCAPGSPFVPGGMTDNFGVIVLDGQLEVKGCDNTGLRLVVQNVPLASCLPIQARTPDMKSSGPFPSPCGGYQLCPDGKVSIADFAFFGTGYATVSNPSPVYFPCHDFWAPFGAPIGLPDLSLFVVHMFPSGHFCM